MPAPQTYIIEPIWEQSCAPLPERDVDPTLWAATALASPTG
jgi:hypothetical protein